jgi:hypothetical protein
VHGDAGASDGDAGASGNLAINAANTTPVGESTTFVESAVNTFLSASANDGAVVDSYGTGISDGFYLIDDESIPEDDAKFLGRFKLNAIAPLAAVSGDGEVDVASYHHVYISYNGPDGPDEDDSPDVGTWYIMAETNRGLYPVQNPNTGDGMEEWIVSYNLPEGYDLDHIGVPWGDGDRKVEGPLSIDISFAWDYTTAETATVAASVNYEDYISTYGYATAEAPSESSAMYQWNASSYACA